MPINYSNISDAGTQDIIRGLVLHLFAGDDNFSIAGTVSSVWGDFKSVPAEGTVVLGSDIINLTGLTVATGFGSVTVFGDAQIADSGTTSIAGNDNIDARWAGAPLTIYGDFQTADGTVTYGDDAIYGGSQADTIYGDSPTSTGSGGDDLLDGGYGADSLFGGGGNDLLAGGADADLLNGGQGFDIAVYYNVNITPLVVDLADPTQNTAEAAGDTFVSIEGLVGIDAPNYGNDDLRGDDNANTLRGRAGNDTLTGRGGNDTLDGGAGDDTLIVDNAGDKVFEAVGDGHDAVYASVTYALAAGQEIETLATTSGAGTSAINLTGNAFSQVIYGNDGVNSLRGGGGNDTLIGRGGNDTYYVDSSGDHVVEAVGGGHDTVFSTVSYALQSGQEIETLATGSASAINLNGNEFAQVIYGNDSVNSLHGGGGNDTLVAGGGNDYLSGELGNDTLTGGAGRDTFYFTTALNASTNVDAITDFSHADDTIGLDHSVFSALGTGALAASAFHTGASATTSAQHILYNDATGNLYYDADGSGGTAQIQFAHLTAHLALAADDFMVVV